MHLTLCLQCSAAVTKGSPLAVCIHSCLSIWRSIIVNQDGPFTHSALVPVVCRLDSDVSEDDEAAELEEFRAAARAATQAKRSREVETINLISSEEDEPPLKRPAPKQRTIHQAFRRQSSSQANSQQSSQPTPSHMATGQAPAAQRPTTPANAQRRDLPPGFRDALFVQPGAQAAAGGGLSSGGRPPGSMVIRLPNRPQQAGRPVPSSQQPQQQVLWVAVTGGCACTCVGTGIGWDVGLACVQSCLLALLSQ